VYSCKILADSVCPLGYRLTTFEVTFPRFILAGVNTHRMLSRNSASSRAIPVAKSIEAVERDPFVPMSFGRNQPGMSYSEYLEYEAQLESHKVWLSASSDALFAAQKLAQFEVHKSLANRVLEPFKWHTAILSGTDWSNFFALRTDKNAQPEFRTIALMMQEAYRTSKPNFIGPQSGELHLPLVSYDEILDLSGDEIDWSFWAQISIGRCARVSYLTHDGKRDLNADVELYHRLRTNGHLSPFEHVARPFSHDEWAYIASVQYAIQHTNRDLADAQPDLADRMCKQVEYCGNYRGWYQWRATVPNQDDFSQVKDAID
jgi:thymidylate synthase ThyX